MHHESRLGVTLLELIVAIALIGLVTAVAGLGVRHREGVTVLDAVDAVVASARQTAIDSGTPVTRTILVHGSPHSVTALPDGSMIADSSVLIDRLAGTPLDSAQTEPEGAAQQHTRGGQTYAR